MRTGPRPSEAVAPFGRDEGTALAHAPGSRRGETPGKACPSAPFRRPDVAAFEAQPALWVASRLPDAGGRALATDGKAALRLLGAPPVKGDVFTGDAAFCQRDLGAKAIEGGGGDVLVVKEGQPSLATGMAAGLAFGGEKRRQGAASSPPRGGPAAAGGGRPDGGQGARPA